MNKEFCFVVLNYNTYDFTVACINSIKKFSHDNNYQIIIVDNSSPDNSGKQLLEKYKSCSTVDVILNDKNLGFSKGNNVGIDYARIHYNPKFIIVNNSDTELLSNTFYEHVKNAYKKYRFAVLGPKVINPPEDLVQYKPIKLLNKKQVRHTIIAFYIRLILNYFYLLKLDDLLFVRKNKKYTKNSKDVCTIYEDVVIHGCFFIFSNEYLKNFKGIPEFTDFYREEEFIYLNCKSKKLKTLYYPNIEILHNVNGAIKSSYSNIRKRNIFKYKKHITANKVLYKLLKENNYEI